MNQKRKKENPIVYYLNLATIPPATDQDLAFTSLERGYVYS